MPTVRILRCSRGILTLIALFITLNATTLPSFTVSLSAAYICLSAAIAAFDAGGLRLPYKLLYHAPFLVGACAAGGFSWVMWLGTATLTLPFLQSFGIAPFTGSSLGVGLAISILLVEIAIVHSRGYDLDTLTTVHGSTAAIVALSMFLVIYPQFALFVAWNPVFLFIQARGVLSMWTTREKDNLVLLRQHTIGACASLSVMSAFVFVVFILSEVAGTAVLRVGDTYAESFSAVQAYIGLVYPLMLICAVNIHGAEGEHMLVKLGTSLLLLFDGLFVPAVLVGPGLMRLSYRIMSFFVHSEAGWTRIPSLVMTVVMVSLLSLTWETVLEWIPLEVCKKKPVEGAGYQMGSLENSDEMVDCLADEDIDVHTSGAQ